MRHIKLKNNIPVNYTLEQLLIDIPDAVIYLNSQMPHPDLLANYSVYALVTTPQPTLKEDEAAEEGVAEFKDGEWYQTWTVRQLTSEEIQEIIDVKTVGDEFVVENAGILETSGVSFLADSETQTIRYDICKSCPLFTILKTCKECGCIMPLKIKVASASCPLKKW